MYCQKCGAQIPEDSEFCTTCGERVPGPASSDHTVSGNPEYAGFSPRFGAMIIDNIILWIIISVVMSIYYEICFMGSPVRSAYDPLLNPEDTIAFALFFLIDYLYYAGLQSSSRQATIGKSVVGLIVTDTDGRRLTFGRATLRYIGRIIACIPLCLGFLLIIFTEKKQGLHDLMADTVVIRKRA